ncbi:uncharacterized protein LOC134712044 isoform X2 [Mytilus trossulus]|uniref:uncharacterized protein LOC134712044 isoform X2 n=1 Tax=Mytilus trossulus TaxID=6551 RepID=UPI0030065888
MVLSFVCKIVIVYVTMANGIIQKTDDNLEICSNSCETMVQDLQLSQSEADILHSAPCPPPWDMSLLFSSTIRCLDCAQRVQILQKCLKEWNITIDCENIISCEDCISCDVCNNDSSTDNNETALDETTKENGIVKQNDNDTVNVKMIVLIVMVTLTTCSLFPIAFMVYKQRRRRQRRSINNKPNKKDITTNVETADALVNDTREEEDDKMNVSHQLLNENVQNSSEEIIT